MAKRKLSPQQRITIRKEIRQLIGQKKKQADILRVIAEKYGITTITARWYYKGIVQPAKQSRGKSRATRQYATRRTRRKTRISADGASLKLVQQVQSVAAKSLKRALQVKKLIPKWQHYVKKEASLRQMENRLKRQLRSISSKAGALHRRIQALTPK
jgi:hypothetical protein